MRHNSQTYATYAKSNPNPKRQATAYRNLTGTETQVCVQLVHPHVHYAWLYVIDYYTSFYNVYISLHMQLGMHQSTRMQTNMHAHCVCAVCLYPAYNCMYAYLHLYVQIFLCSIPREWSPPTSVAQSQWTSENLLLGIQAKTDLELDDDMLTLPFTISRCYITPNCTDKSVSIASYVPYFVVVCNSHNFFAV